MADDYQYAVVKDFVKYKSVLDKSGYNFNIGETNDPIVNRCKKIVSGTREHGFFIIDLCIKLNTYFKTYSDYNKYNTEHCEYLNYWLNDVYNKNKTHSLYKEILDSKNPLNIFDSTITYINTYKSKLHHIREDIFKRIETLYKLYDEYILLITKKENNKPNNELCNHAKNISSEFNNSIHECNDKEYNKYCIELQILKERYEYKIPTEMCPNVPPLNSLPEIYKTKISSYSQDYRSDESDSYSAGDITALVGKIFGGCIGLLLLYKVTPLKSFLSFRKRKQKRDWDNLDDEVYDNYAYNYGNSYGHNHGSNYGDHYGNNYEYSYGENYGNNYEYNYGYNYENEEIMPNNRRHNIHYYSSQDYE
ncbi:PIR Superfamily Protein [Plasmodium ovale curtisi]|uniref:PIR Superfamily Protein n=1 Tax=Plasmodium ovale curtisi TaxID=864141 RepID=A0A1A8WXA2_PLAOA|nr:PIR Superfamily Protein [Plasmodium ovale curtisi]SBS98941.1 PIR Superfamily Protein [Plasmodium ovale curtisi]